MFRLGHNPHWNVFTTLILSTAQGIQAALLLGKSFESFLEKMSKRKSSDDDWDDPDPEFWGSVRTPKRENELDDGEDELLASIRTPKRRCLPPLPADDWDDDEMDGFLGNYSGDNQVGGGFVPVPVENVAAVPPEVGQPLAPEPPPATQPEFGQAPVEPTAVVQPEIGQPPAAKNAPHMNFNDLFSIRQTGERKAKKFGLSMFIYAIDIAPLPFNLNNATSLLVLPELFSAIYRVCTSEFLPDDKIIITMSCQNLDLGELPISFLKR